MHHRRALAKSITAVIVGLTAFGLIVRNAVADEEAKAGEWSCYGRDAGGLRHSPLDQINRENVATLEVAWTFHTGDLEKLKEARSGGNSAFEATPLMIDGRLYFSTPTGRVFALDAASGEELWHFDPQIDLSHGYSEFTSRGVSTWVDANAPRGEPRHRRIYLATIDARLFCLDADTGTACEDFGTGGTVHLSSGIDVRYPGNYQVTSPPAVIGDLVIVGSAIGDNGRFDEPAGVVRAFDAKSGELKWSWDPIPRDPSDPGYETWKSEKAHKTGAANVWSIISADPARDLVFLPTSSPSPDYYGGERPGQNLYGNSVVALRASTGKPVWHYQVVHHDLWDYDVPAQPVLFDLKREGETIPAVAVGTKMGFLFVLHRETGEPLFPVEERPVPKTDVEGEASWPTQPFPTFLPKLGLHEPKAWGLNDEARASAQERMDSLRFEGIYTPPSIQGSLIAPCNVGGLNWSGLSIDPERQVLVTNVNRLAAVIHLIPREDFGTARGQRLDVEYASQSGTPFGMSREIFISPAGLPATEPPWGTLAAIDLSTGKLMWEVPLGIAAPELSLLPDASKWGSPNLGGAITTAGGLIFVAASRDNRFRAFDIETGERLWQATLPAGGQATPMTYELDGKQYVVLCAGGHGKLGTKLGDAVIAYTLP